MIDGVGYTNERLKVRKEVVDRNGGDRVNITLIKGVTTVGRTDSEGHTRI